MIEGKNYIIRKSVVDIKNTLLGLPNGKTFVFDCREFALYSSVQATVSRLNATLGKKEFSCSSISNGVKYTITRH